MKEVQNLDWYVGCCGLNNEEPKEYIKATVPGCIQKDFAIAYDYPDFNIADNFKEFDFMENNYFLYKAKLPNIKPGQRMILNALGIDYEYDITVNGKSIYHYEGMFSPTVIDITEYIIGDDTIGVLIYPIPRISNPVLERDNVRESCKPGVTYGWDFHPKIVTRGIWDDFTVVITDGTYFTDWDIDTYLSSDFSNALGTVIAKVSDNKNASVKTDIFSPNGEMVFSSIIKAGEKIDFSIPNPELWWPNGYGEAKLYSFELSLLVNETKVDSIKFKRGFRKIELIQYDGIWDLPIIFPAGENPQPNTFLINGKRIFAQGTNWVCPTVFYGELNREMYEVQLRLIKDANMNIVRSWGGAIVNKEPFFDLCDEYGLLVWQDFPLACNQYVETEKYLNTLNNESTAIIKRLKKHTCLALWSGGNELFNEWSRMSIQSKSIRLLNKNCFEFDPETPFIPTSPISGFRHGDYRFRDKDGREIMEFINNCDATGYNEMGCASAADEDIIRYIIPESELNTIEKGTAWETHNALGAWMKESHLYIDTIKYYFGDNLSLKDIIKCSRILQSVGYKYIFEEARRQAPRCGMILNWCFNEPWYNAAGNNVITYDNKPKESYYAICQALEPSKPSLRYNKFEYHNGEEIKAQVWWLSQNPVAINGEISVYVNTGDVKKCVKKETVKNDSILLNQHLFDCSFTISLPETAVFTVSVEYIGANGDVISSEYGMLCKV